MMRLLTDETAHTALAAQGSLLNPSRLFLCYRFVSLIQPGAAQIAFMIIVS